MTNRTTITGIFERTRWRSPEGDRMIGFLEDGTGIRGRADEGELTPGLPYEFHGKFAEPYEGRQQFDFELFVQKEPHSRHGVVSYLARYAPGVGPAVAARLWDAFGGEAVKILRTQPEAAVLADGVGRFLTLDKAREASQALQAMAELEDTKISLTTLFRGRGFPGALIEACIEKWRILAPARIKRDPFCLLVNEMPGCGFARCDRLYLDLGLPPDRLKRQTICLWHALHADSSGHTWIEMDLALGKLARMVSGTSIKKKKAVLLGCRSGWLARRRDAAGKLWLAEGDRARAEKFLGEQLLSLGSWEPPAEEESCPIANEDCIESSKCHELTEATSQEESTKDASTLCST